MDFGEAAVLVAAGLAAGGVNAVAGGGSLITFPTLLALGMPPVAANVTNSVAVVPGYLAAVGGSARDLSGQRGDLLRLLPSMVLGSAAGCALLLLTPATAFAWAAPALVLAASGALAAQDRLRAIAGEPHPAARQLLVALAACYGGYFGAALGVLLIAVLALTSGERLARVGAAKNVVAAVVGAVTVLAFGGFGPVSWATVGVLAPAAMLGGYAGARLATRLPAKGLRTAIVAVGVAVGLTLLAVQVL
ncbi:sulfite exporter TauE/SafE family protein [Pilimelia columellifera]|uniref:Probable membrane transporter protein n=1 Tax=Pilimelia columellifera subsp. columellifera TaxID=706583 RepID=A0ABN3NR16_9ACTN